MFQAQTVVQGGHAALSATGSRMSCQWTHPAKLACTAGRNLVQCQLAGAGRAGRVVLLHSRPEGDPFLGLATPSQVHCTQLWIEFTVDGAQRSVISMGRWGRGVGGRHQVAMTVMTASTNYAVARFTRTVFTLLLGQALRQGANTALMVCCSSYQIGDICRAASRCLSNNC